MRVPGGSPLSCLVGLPGSSSRASLSGGQGHLHSGPISSFGPSRRLDHTSGVEARDDYTWALSVGGQGAWGGPAATFRLDRVSSVVV